MEYKKRALIISDLREYLDSKNAHKNDISPDIIKQIE